MIRIRKGSERGFADHGWLRTHHTFSFAGYQDTRFTGFRSLRVLNDDRIAAAVEEQAALELTGMIDAELLLLDLA